MRWQIIILTLLLVSFVSAECIDSDGGKNKYDSGQVIDDQATYYDGCQDNDIKEYFCSVDNIASYTILPCLNGCKNNACQIADRAPITAAPEEEKYPYIEYYFAGIAAIIIIGLYILYLFKFKRKFKKRKYEEY